MYIIYASYIIIYNHYALLYFYITTLNYIYIINSVVHIALVRYCHHHIDITHIIMLYNIYVCVLCYIYLLYIIYIRIDHRYDHIYMIIYNGGRAYIYIAADDIHYTPYDDESYASHTYNY